MAGIGYDSSIVVYNKTGGTIGTEETWYGTRLEKVRVELTQGNNIRSSGRDDADKCQVKIHDEDLPTAYYPPALWKKLPDKLSGVTFDGDTIFIIEDKADIGAAAVAPTGQISDDAYQKGLFEYLTGAFGYTYRVTTADHYSLIPHWEIGGR